MVTYFSCCGKIADIDHVKDGRCVSAYSFTCFLSWLLRSMWLRRWLGRLSSPGSEKQRKELTETRCDGHRHASRNLLLPSSLSKLPMASKTLHSTHKLMSGNSQHVSLWGTFHFLILMDQY